MAREAAETDFVVEVDGVGSFTFGKRTMRDEIKVQVEYARFIEGVEPTEWLALVAGWISTLKVMTVRAPDGWNLDELDPMDDNTYAKLQKVNQGLSAKERSFRSVPDKTTEKTGQSTS